MRVTQQMMYSRSMTSIGQNRSRQADLMNQIESGRRLHSLGDDPAATPVVLRHESALRRMKTDQDTLSKADHMLASSDAALGDVTNLTQRLEEITIQFSNSTYNAEDRAKAADEVIMIRDQLVDLANTKTEDGRYLFGGLNNAGEPFSKAAGTEGNFGGDAGKLSVHVGRSKIDTTVAGGQPFVDPAEDLTPPAVHDADANPSLFDTITSLAEAVRTDPEPPVVAPPGTPHPRHKPISDHLTKLKEHGDRIAATREGLGHSMNRVKSLQDGLETAKLASSSVLSETRDTDWLSAASELQMVSTALQGAMMTTAKISSLNLMNFM